MTDRLIGLTHVLVSHAEDPAVARDTLRLLAKLTRAVPGRAIDRLVLEVRGEDERRAAEAWAEFRDMLER